MKFSRFARRATVVMAVLAMAGCPLPFEFNGANGGSAHSTDPSTPDMTAPVTASYTVQGGGSGTIADGGSFVGGQTTTVTISTATVGAVIFYTTDGTTLTNLRNVQKFNASSGTFTISRTTGAQSLDIHAVAVGPNLLPSLPIHVTVSVSPYPILTLTVDKASVTEDGGIATFTVTSSIAPTSDITVNLLTGGDYSTTYETGLTAAPAVAFTTVLTHGTTSTTLAVTGIHDPSTVSHTVSLAIQDDTAVPQTYTTGSTTPVSFMLLDDGSKTLTVTSSGNGTTTPAGAVSVTSGAATSITATAGAHDYLVGWTVTAGSGATFGSTGTATSTRSTDTVTLTSGNATVQANFAPVPVNANYFVNAATGNDSNIGIAMSQPFKTITKALNVAASGQVVNVAAGIYDAANGETFPLYIPAGVSLIGDETAQGVSTIIRGGGTPTVYPASFISNAVVMALNTVLAGFTVTNNSGLSSNPMGILVNGTGYSANNATIRNNTIVGNPGMGVYVVDGASGGAITGNNFSGNGGFDDVAFVGNGGAGMSLSYNTFADMVELDNLGPDLGGGAAGSPGHNSFLGPSSTYIGVSSGNVFAQSNHWRHNPPTVGALQSGFDVGTQGATVDTTGYY